jgi:hypothetical protein
LAFEERVERGEVGNGGVERAEQETAPAIRCMRRENSSTRPFNRT